jgi:glutamate synthase domain-containing protein 1
MLEEDSSQIPFETIIEEATMEALLGRKFPFEFVGNVSDEDDELEYLTYTDVPISKSQVRNISKANLNRTLRVVLEGKTPDQLKRMLNNIRKMISVKYKEVRNKYVQ